jgi:class 3 adenylate cyclase
MIGSTVNLAARLMSAVAKEQSKAPPSAVGDEDGETKDASEAAAYDASECVLVCSSTHREAGKDKALSFEKRPSLQLKGFSEPTVSYRPRLIDHGTAIDDDELTALERSPTSRIKVLRLAYHRSFANC